MIGQTVSHYKILEKLGEGGMGVVYRAQDLRLDRTVALKFFPPDLCADLERKKRFVQEAKIASSIDHPNVVAIYEIDEIENDNLFIAMAYYNGETLNSKIRKGPLKLHETVDIALQVAKGLAKSHELGIVHQDIKPSNVLITSDGVAKILDFGVATLNEPRVEHKSVQSIAGTLPYMSPEQIYGEPTDHRTDIWSLGVVLYEMVSGHGPFTKEYDQAVQYSILNENPTPIQHLPESVSSDVQSILDKALEKNPAERFQRVEDIIPLLKSIKEKVASGTDDLKQAIAVLPFVDLSPLRDHEYFCDGLAEELISALSKVSGLRISSRISSFQFKGKTEDIQIIGKRLKVSSVLEGSVRKSGDNLRITAQLIDIESGYQLWSERYDRKLQDVFAIQEEIAHMIVQTLKIKLLPQQDKRLVKRATENVEAYSLYLEGRYHWNRRTEESMTKAIELFKRAIEQDPSFALAYTGIADAYSLLDKYGELPLRESVQLARAAAKKALELDPNLAEARTSLAEIQMSYDWDWLGAEQTLKEALQLNPIYATAHHWLAICFSGMGRFRESFDAMDRALELDPLSLIMIRDKGILYYYARRFDEAIQQAQKVLELDPNFALAHRLLAIAYERKGMYSEAIKENRIWGALTSDALRTEAALGHIYAVSKMKEKAAKVLELLARDGASRKDLTFGFALIHTGLGNNDLAFKWLDQSFDDRSGALGMIKVDPKLDSLRADPRFAVLLRKMKLEER